MKAGGTSPSSAGISGWLSGQRAYIGYRLRQLASLSVRAAASMHSRGLAATLRLAAGRLFPPSRVPNPLKLYGDFLPGQKVRLDEVPHPVASIVVPVHGQLDYTLRCLHALAHGGDSASFEVIVVDDASTDATPAVLAAIHGLRYLRNANNLGFIGSCNAGAAIARGEYLVLLNNDTVVQPGWLDALLRTFSIHPDTGLAGSKLVYPDGRLQEAGGIIFSDGSAANYGRNADPADPRFNFVREADYCSGAAIALRRSLFEQLGGLDSHYSPAYFEDTDLAMRVRESGLKVRYQPASVVVHFEGASSGTDVRTGVKAYQLVNQQKFLARWKSVLEKSHPALRPAERDSLDRAARHRCRRHVLIVDSYTPTPDRDSGSLRMVALMKLLLEEGCSVTFFNQLLGRDGAYTEALQQLGVEAWWRPWISSVPHWLRRQGPRFDAIIASRHYVLAPLLPLLRRFAPGAFVVFDTVDLHFLREQREAERSGDPAALRKASRTQKLELDLARQSDATWVVSTAEQALLAGLLPASPVSIVSNIHQCAQSPGDFFARNGGIFVGSFRHPPNVDAACWLITAILPLVRSRLPDFRLHIVGADAPVILLELANQPGVSLHGHVPGLEALLDSCRLSVAPLRFGAGIKGKINQSLARGLPVVATSCAIEGMFLTGGLDVLCADSAEGFAEAIVSLHADQALWLHLRGAGLQNTQRHFSPDAARDVLRPWLEGLR